MTITIDALQAFYIFGLLVLLTVVLIATPTIMERRRRHQ